MILFFQIQRDLLLLSLIVEILLVLRLLHQGLFRRYPFFTMYLANEITWGILAIRVQFLSPAYAETFRNYVILTAILRIGVAWELYERICEHFPGIGRFRFALASLLILITATASVGSFKPDLPNQWALLTLIRRFQGEIFAGVFLFAWVFFRYVLNVQQPFRPNVLNHWRISTVYFGVSGLHALAVLILGRGFIALPINCAMLAADIGCFVAWIRLMKRSGEELPWFYRLSPAEIEAVRRQNDELLETVTSLPREIWDGLKENPSTPSHRARPS